MQDLIRARAIPPMERTRNRRCRAGDSTQYQRSALWRPPIWVIQLWGCQDPPPGRGSHAPCRAWYDVLDQHEGGDRWMSTGGKASDCLPQLVNGLPHGHRPAIWDVGLSGDLHGGSPFQCPRVRARLGFRCATGYGEQALTACPDGEERERSGAEHQHDDPDPMGGRHRNADTCKEGDIGSYAEWALGHEGKQRNGNQPGHAFPGSLQKPRLPAADPAFAGRVAGAEWTAAHSDARQVPAPYSSWRRHQTNGLVLVPPAGESSHSS